VLYIALHIEDYLTELIRGSKLGLEDKLRAWLSLVRIGNTVIVGLAALVGYVICGGNISSHKPLLLFIAASSIAAGTYVINDYFDRDIDSVNKPWRPIPSGLVSAYMAYAVALTLLCMGVAISIIISTLSLVIAMVAAVLSYLYSWKLKRVLIVGNIVVSLSAALSIIYGGAATSNPIPALVPALYAFLINLGREFVKGIEDVEGDRMYRVDTLATRYGVHVAYTASLTVLLLLVAISPLPFIALSYSLLYLLIAVIGVDIPIIVALITARRKNPESAWKATRIMKISLLMGLIAFLFR